MDARNHRRSSLHQTRIAATTLFTLVSAFCAGCAVRSAPPLKAPYPNQRSVIVAPLLNQSPSDGFDTIVATDTMVAELAQVEGLTVIPTNNALKLLLARRQEGIRSIADAIDLAHRSGADGVLVGAITEYRPYKPQKLGITLQLYWVRADKESVAVDPAALARHATGEGPAAIFAGPAAQVAAVLDASRNDVVDSVRAYAQGREGNDSAYGWRKYLVDSDAYMHFACHEMIVRLLDQELHRITVPVRVR